MPAVAAARFSWMSTWLASSLVGMPPSLKPHTMRQASPSSFSSTMPSVASGSSATLRMNAPARVTRKNERRMPGAASPIGTHELAVS